MGEFFGNRLGQALHFLLDLRPGGLLILIVEEENDEPLGIDEGHHVHGAAEIFLQPVEENGADGITVRVPVFVEIGQGTGHNLVVAEGVSCPNRQKMAPDLGRQLGDSAAGERIMRLPDRKQEKSQKTTPGTDSMNPGRRIMDRRKSPGDGGIGDGKRGICIDYFQTFLYTEYNQSHGKAPNGKQEETEWEKRQLL